MSNNLVLIPGLNNTRAVFDGVLAELPPTLSAHALDCPPIDSVEGIAQALLADLPERFWLAGFSFGGYVAMAMLELAPQRIEGIALICTGPHADRPERAAARQRSIAAARSGEYLAMVAASAPNTMHPDHLKDERLIAARQQMVTDYGAARYIAHTQAAIARPDRAHLLHGGLPTLLVGAEDDRVFPLPLVQALAVEMPHARLVEIGASGHLVPMERPRAVAQALAQWMQR